MVIGLSDWPERRRSRIRRGVKRRHMPRTRCGQEESLGPTTVWTFVRLLRLVNGPSTTDDVRRAAGHSGRWRECQSMEAMASFADVLPATSSNGRFASVRRTAAIGEPATH